MTTRTSIVEQISEYFAKKGAPMTAEEYKSAPDAPIRFQLVKRHIGSWSRLLNMVSKLSTKALVAAPVVEVTPEPTPEPKPTAAPVEQKEPPVVQKTKGA